MITVAQIEKQKKYFYGAILDLLWKSDEGYPYLDSRIQTLINQIEGSNKIFNYQPEILTIISCLETARTSDTQFRKCVLDAANMVNRLKGSDSDV